MKTKKRNHRNYVPYTEGRNMFGDKATTKLIVLKRETALEQMIEAVSKLSGEMEFTFDARCFIGHEAEYQEILYKVEAFMAMKARALTAF